MWQILKSSQDASVNFIKQSSDNGMWEARFVQRVPEYFITYLSSHSGCNKSCRFCHLTATKQKMMTPASKEIYLEQADQVFSYYGQKIQNTEQTEKIVNINFMARGEPLANPEIILRPLPLFDALSLRADKFSLKSQLMISSIIPEDFSGNLEDIFSDERATLYYSLYSTDEKFRKRWLPKAMNANRALDKIAEFQAKTGRPIVIHWAFIEGHNDNEEQLHKTMEEFIKRGIKARFNLVRYNPYGELHGKEPEEDKIIQLFNIVTSYLPDSNSRIVPRVGFDVKASCGMFVSK